MLANRKNEYRNWNYAAGEEEDKETNLNVEEKEMLKMVYKENVSEAPVLQ